MNKNKERAFSFSEKSAPAIAEALGVEVFDVNREMESIVSMAGRIKTLAYYAQKDLEESDEDCIGRIIDTLSMIVEESERLQERLEV